MVRNVRWIVGSVGFVGVCVVHLFDSFRIYPFVIS